MLVCHHDEFDVDGLKFQVVKPYQILVVHPKKN